MKTSDLNGAVLIWGCASPAFAGSARGCRIIVPENRPFLYGLLHNLPLLEESGSDLLYCTDNMIGSLLFRGKIDRTVVFHRKEVEPGRFLCPPGSSYAYLLSRLHGVDVVFMPQGDCRPGPDAGAGTLAGKPFVPDADACFVLDPEDELIGADLFEGHENDRKDG